MMNFDIQFVIDWLSKVPPYADGDEASSDTQTEEDPEDIQYRNSEVITVQSAPELQNSVGESDGRPSDVSSTPGVMEDRFPNLSHYWPPNVVRGRGESDVTFSNFSSQPTVLNSDINRSSGRPQPFLGNGSAIVEERHNEGDHNGAYLDLERPLSQCSTLTSLSNSTATCPHDSMPPLESHDTQPGAGNRYITRSKARAARNEPHKR